VICGVQADPSAIDEAKRFTGRMVYLSPDQQRQSPDAVLKLMTLLETRNKNVAACNFNY